MWVRLGAAALGTATPPQSSWPSRGRMPSGAGYPFASGLCPMAQARQSPPRPRRLPPPPRQPPHRSMSTVSATSRGFHSSGLRPCGCRHARACLRHILHSPTPAAAANATAKAPQFKPLDATQPASSAASCARFPTLRTPDEGPTVMDTITKFFRSCARRGPQATLVRPLQQLEAPYVRTGVALLVPHGWHGPAPVVQLTCTLLTMRCRASAVSGAADEYFSGARVMVIDRGLSAEVRAGGM
jgi:hypothetical protein